MKEHSYTLYSCRSIFSINGWMFLHFEIFPHLHNRLVIQIQSKLQQYIYNESPVKFRFLPNSFTSLEELTCIVECFDASCFVVLVAQNGNTLVSYLFFYNVNKIYECYEARSAFSLFKMNELFSHHFPGFNLEIYDPRTYHNPIRFSWSL